MYWMAAWEYQKIFISNYYTLYQTLIKYNNFKHHNLVSKRNSQTKDKIDIREKQKGKYQLKGLVDC